MHFARANRGGDGYTRAMRPTRRLIKTEIVLPETTVGRAAVIGSLVVGGTVAVTMVALFAVFLIETFKVSG